MLSINPIGFPKHPGGIATKADILRFKKVAIKKVVHFILH